jgi:hypothetical protein
MTIPEDISFDTGGRQILTSTVVSCGEKATRYRRLVCGQSPRVADANAPGLLVKGDCAHRQIETAKTPGGVVTGDQKADGSDGAPGRAGVDALFASPPPQPGKPKRFHGGLQLDAACVNSAAGIVAESIITHLSGVVGAYVKVTMAIEAEVAGSVPDNAVRLATEKGRALKFTTYGFVGE